MLPKPMTTFPTLFSPRCVYVTVLHVNYTGIPKWNILEGITTGKGKSCGFSSFLCVKMWIQELHLKQLSWPVMFKLCGENLNKDTEELGF